MYLLLGENRTNDTGGLSSSNWLIRKNELFNILNKKGLPTSDFIHCPVEASHIRTKPSNVLMKQCKHSLKKHILLKNVFRPKI
uniref:Uncharacterized protein n=1 Tax=Romanomermis culicivorax TaxID=13658 RepID=A0A915JCD5_ROMCU